MRDLLLFAVFSGFLLAGFSAPHIIGLGYVWADLFAPQYVAFSFVRGIPMSLILGAGAAGSWLLFGRSGTPRPTGAFWLMLAWAGWVTLTTTWAEVPASAWEKWNWSVKSLGIAAFLPFLFRTRLHVEAMLMVMVAAIAANLIPFGAKTILTGGGYGMALGVGGGAGLLAESSTLANAAVATIPLILYLRRHSLILPPTPLVRWGWNGLIVLAVATAIGTFARTGLIDLAVLVALSWLGMRHKLPAALVMVAAAGALFGFDLLPKAWAERMATIGTFGSENSALGRVAVWLWTLDYVAQHPLGGGFNAFLINHFVVPVEGTGQFLEIRGKAYHSMYFEALGEHGWIGLALLLAVIAAVFVYAWRAGRGQEPWAADLARAITAATIVYCVGGAFIGVAFQPFLYYQLAMAVSLWNLRHRPPAARQTAACGITARPDAVAPWRP